MRLYIHRLTFFFFQIYIEKHLVTFKSCPNSLNPQFSLDDNCQICNKFFFFQIYIEKHLVAFKSCPNSLNPQFSFDDNCQICRKNKNFNLNAQTNNEIIHCQIRSTFTKSKFNINPTTKIRD